MFYFVKESRALWLVNQPVFYKHRIKRQRCSLHIGFESLFPIKMCSLSNVFTFERKIWKVLFRNGIQHKFPMWKGSYKDQTTIAEMINSSPLLQTVQLSCVVSASYEQQTTETTQHYNVVKNGPQVYFQIISTNIGQYQQFLVDAIYEVSNVYICSSIFLIERVPA